MSGVATITSKSNHAAQAVGRIDRNRFGRVEGIAGLQLPAEIGGIDAHDQAQVSVDDLLYLNGEIAAVNEVEAVGVARVLGGVFVHQRHEGVVLMAGAALLAFHGGDSVEQVGTLTIDDLSRELTYKELNSQFFFGTEKSLKYLKRL